MLTGFKPVLICEKEIHANTLNTDRTLTTPLLPAACAARGFNPYKGEPIAYYYSLTLPPPTHSALTCRTASKAHGVSRNPRHHGRGPLTRKTLRRLTPHRRPREAAGRVAASPLHHLHDIAGRTIAK